jgi:hypothetical protein
MNTRKSFVRIGASVLVLGAVTLGVVALRDSPEPGIRTRTGHERPGANLAPGFEDYKPGDPLPTPPTTDPDAAPGTPVPTVQGPYGPIYPDGYTEPAAKPEPTTTASDGEPVVTTTTVTRPLPPRQCRAGEDPAVDGCVPPL